MGRDERIAEYDRLERSMFIYRRSLMPWYRRWMFYTFGELVGEIKWALNKGDTQIRRLLASLFG